MSTKFISLIFWSKNRFSGALESWIQYRPLDAAESIRRILFISTFLTSRYWFLSWPPTNDQGNSYFMSFQSEAKKVIFDFSGAFLRQMKKQGGCRTEKNRNFTISKFIHYISSFGPFSTFQDTKSIIPGNVSRFLSNMTARCSKTGSVGHFGALRVPILGHFERTNINARCFLFFLPELCGWQLFWHVWRLFSGV